MNLAQLADEVNAKNTELELLRNELDGAKHELQEAVKQANDAVQRVNNLENKIQSVLGTKTVNVKKPLREVIHDILSNSNEALTVKTIAELVIEAGYVTKSKPVNFQTIVNQTLSHDEFQRVTKKNVRPFRYEVVES